jgi:hypothetical protein
MTNDPVLIAYAVKRSGSGKHPTWTRIGSAYPHETGAGLTVILDAIPPDGRVILLERDQADDDRLAQEAARIQSRHGKPKASSQRVPNVRSAY